MQLADKSIPVRDFILQGEGPFRPIGKFVLKLKDAFIFGFALLFKAERPPCAFVKLVMEFLVGLARLRAMRVELIDIRRFSIARRMV